MITQLLLSTRLCRRLFCSESHYCEAMICVIAYKKTNPIIRRQYFKIVIDSNYSIDVFNELLVG